jgi:hypothetical protein
MLDKLFSELYKKLKTETENDSQKISGCFNFFVERILEEKYDKKNIVSSKTLTNYYNKYVEGKKNNSGEPKNDIKNIIANYLEYEDYLTFEKSNHKTNIIITNNKDRENKKKESYDSILKRTNGKISVRKITISIFVLLFFLTIYFINSYNNSNIEACIIWNENHFEKSKCDEKNSLNNSLYNLNIEKFKQVDVTSETQFFINGKPIIWYGKSSTGKMDFFLNRGIHPKTLKELKPITETIINKYVFVEKKDKTILE